MLARLRETHRRRPLKEIAWLFLPDPTLWPKYFIRANDVRNAHWAMRLGRIRDAGLSSLFQVSKGGREVPKHATQGRFSTLHPIARVSYQTADSCQAISAGMPCIGLLVPSNRPCWLCFSSGIMLYSAFPPCVQCGTR